MLNKIIEKWIGEEIPFKVYENMEEREMYNSIIQDLKSRIPELEEMIVREMKDMILSKGYTGSVDFKIGFNTAIDMIITTLKGDRDYMLIMQ